VSRPVAAQTACRYSTKFVVYQRHEFGWGRGISFAYFAQKLADLCIAAHFYKNMPSEAVVQPLRNSARTLSTNRSRTCLWSADSDSPGLGFDHSARIRSTTRSITRFRRSSSIGVRAALGSFSTTSSARSKQAWSCRSRSSMVSSQPAGRTLSPTKRACRLSITERVLAVASTIALGREDELRVEAMLGCPQTSFVLIIRMSTTAPQLIDQILTRALYIGYKWARHPARPHGSQRVVLDRRAGGGTSA